MAEKLIYVVDRGVMSKRHAVFRDNFDVLVEEIKRSECISDLAQKAFEKKLISHELNTVAQEDGSADRKASQIVMAIQAGFNYETDKNFDVFVSILREIPSLHQLAEDLMQSLDSGRTLFPGRFSREKRGFKKEPDSGISSIASNLPTLDAHKEPKQAPDIPIMPLPSLRNLFSVGDPNSYDASECSDETIQTHSHSTETLVQNHTSLSSEGDTNVSSSHQHTCTVVEHLTKPESSTKKNNETQSVSKQSEDTQILSYSDSVEHSFPAFSAVQETVCIAAHQTNLVVSAPVTQRQSASCVQTEHQDYLRLDIRQNDAKIFVLQERLTQLSEDKSQLTTELRTKEQEIHRVTVENIELRCELKIVQNRFDLQRELWEKEKQLLVNEKEFAEEKLKYEQQKRS